MEFEYDQRTQELIGQLTDFMESHVYPAEAVHKQWVLDNPTSWDAPPVIEELKAEARRRGLWNLFLPDKEHGAGLTNLQYAPLAEITGR
ncbi:acyl-CoA dehydrogenase, partial [Kutzneria sp. 744]